MSKQKILFLLGNGFSQGFGFPNMNALWDICLKANHEYYTNSLEETRNRYPLSYFISNGIRNIEMLLTVWKSYYESHEVYVSNSNHHESGRGCFQDYIENMCGWLHLYTINSPLDIFKEFKDWLKDAATKYEMTFITTNYDLLLEKALLDNSFNYHYDIEGRKTGSVPIRKLHGSISWFSSSQAILRQYDNFRFNSFFKGEKEKSYVYDFSHSCLSFPTLAGMHMQFGSQLRSDNVVPIFTIIPPVVGKEYNELFNYIIHSIKQDFRDIDYFVIIGYSFPDADPVVKDIIVNFYNESNSKNNKIICINDNQDVCNKINQLFGNKVKSIREKWNVVHFRELFL